MIEESKFIKLLLIIYNNIITTGYVLLIVKFLKIENIALKIQYIL